MNDRKTPPLASMVRAGEAQKEAVKIADGVWRVHDLSSAYLVNCADGDVMINAGFMDNVARNRALFEPVRKGDLKYIILTQSHPDHFGGVPAFKEPGTKTIAEARFAANWADYARLMPFYSKRSRKLWASTVKRDAAPPPPPVVAPDIAVDRQHAVDVGGRRFELLSMGAGETTDTLAVFMPKEKIAFVGNLFGPVFLSMPFLCTLRGEKPRLVQSYLAALARVRALGAETLLAGHSEPVSGAERIRTDLDRMQAAVSFVRDETIAGMNAGKSVHTLMRDIRLPEHLKIGEYHGKVSWAVRSIWEEFAGWFRFESTTEIYDAPRSSIDGDLVELAGGPEKLAARALARIADGKPLEALHLLDIALGAKPGDIASLKAKKIALEHLQVAAGGSNLSETMWLKAEIADVEGKLG